ncbi:cytochrome b [Falsiphaeobacter marinintestinus]|uniref:cytochrome b n=1 Tax=Falsiphaeobacter marinintestinus TaxID=1492905 RepID=UPI0011B4D604|nr:cytochrome b [Phaeobacter marinintestinus]
MAAVRRLYSYDFMSRLNHWIVAALMIGMLAMGIYVFKIMPPSPDRGAIVGIHKSIGLLVLFFGTWRVGWRLAQGFPEEVTHGMQAVFARVVHWVLLIGIVIMPVSGLIGSAYGGRETSFFGLFAIPAGPKIEWIHDVAYGVQGVFAMLLIGATVLHVAGALKHHFINRDFTLLRMVGKA